MDPLYSLSVLRREHCLSVIAHRCPLSVHSLLGRCCSICSVTTDLHTYLYLKRSLCTLLNFATNFSPPSWLLFLTYYLVYYLVLFLPYMFDGGPSFCLCMVVCVRVCACVCVCGLYVHSAQALLCQKTKLLHQEF